MSTVRSIIEKQNHIFGLIARAFDNTKKLGLEKINKFSLDARLQSLEANWEKFQANHDKLVGSLTDEIRKHTYFADDLYAECEENYFDSKSRLMQAREPFLDHSVHANDSVQSQTSSSGTCRSLPKISLPKFSGEYHDWPSFRDLFHSMVGSNRDISSVEKLHYLKTQITGEAARYLANISVTAENFSRAWQALTSRYKNRRILATTYLDHIFNLKPLTHKSSFDLKTLLSTVKESLGALQSLGAPTEYWDILIVYFVTRRLDAHTLEAWELENENSNELATFDQLELFLEGRIRALETVQSRASTSLSAAAKSSPKFKSSARAHAAVLSNLKCSFCNAAHYIALCQEFAAKSLKERQDFTTRKNLCFNCPGVHRLSECRTMKRCQLCKGHHHTLLHRDVVSPPTASTSTNTSTASSASSSKSPTASIIHSHHAALTFHQPQVLLATACMTLIAEHGETLKVRALLDQGSEVSLIQESLVQLLRLPRCRASLPIISVGAQNVGSTRGVVSLRLRSRIDPSNEIKVSAFILPRVTDRVPSQAVSTTSWNHLADLPLADPEFATPGVIDLILGADVYGTLLCGPIKQGPSNSAVAQETSFGWIVSGPTTFTSTPSCPVSFAIRSAKDINLHEELQRFWLQEEVISSASRRRNPDEIECEKHFLATHCRDETGRYIVRLPFRSPPKVLGESRSTAAKVLERVRHRIQRDHAFGNLYSDFMTEYERLGHMQPVKNVQGKTSPVYLPHHGVLRESSSTTKLRVVFNGSSLTSTGVSLNDCLHAGPKLQQDLDAILLRWRKHAFVFAADIEKMYRQILIHPDDRDHQRILWSAVGAPQEFQLNTVTYGLTCAPYLALRSIQQLASDEEHHFPLAAELLRNETYVDDILSGADSPHEAQTKAVQLNELLRAGGFRLQKWASNDESIVSDISESVSDRELPTEARTLGLAWCPATDTFSFHVHQPNSLTPTKRSVLPRIAQFFDPLGWLGPVIIVGKIFIQRLWKSQIGWDDPLPPSLAHDWLIFDEKLKGVSELTIPRWLGTSSSVPGVELHGFADASQEALGAVIYLRTFHEYADAKVVLLTAKSKVAPVKRQTIPRLELSATVLLARLLARVRAILNYQHVPMHLWTDSTVSLAWIRGHPSKWKDFVSNRVAAIQELVPTARWHHVAGVDNPADCLSRGLSPLQLHHHHLWWQGLKWLHGPSVGWPSDTPPVDQSIDLEERSQKSMHVVTVRANPEGWELIHRFSQLNRLLRITAWIIRATDRFKGVQSPIFLTADEIFNARKFWLKETQRIHFGRELDLC